MMSIVMVMSIVMMMMKMPMMVLIVGIRELVVMLFLTMTLAAHKPNIMPGKRKGGGAGKKGSALVRELNGKDRVMHYTNC